MMMTFVNMDAPGITILPTHRVVHGLENFSSPDFITKASAFFNITELDSARPQLIALNDTTGTAFIAATGDGNYLLTAKPDAIAPAPRRHLPPASASSTSSSSTHRPRQAPRPRPGDHHPPRQRPATSARPTKPSPSSQSGDANIAFLIKPITLDQLKDVSLSGDVMPQKSTDFYPKLLSGLAIYALD